MTAAQARVRTAEVLDKIDKGEDHRRPRRSTSGATLAEAWDYYRKTLERGRRPRSLRTIEAYERAFGMLKSLHSVPLRVLANDPQRVAEEHERESVRITPLRRMRPCASCGRATAPMPSPDWIQHFAPKCIRQVRSSGTTVKGEEKGMGQGELKGWFRDLLANVNDPVRREMHYFTLLTGIRRGDKRDQWEMSGFTTLRWSDVSVRRREVTLQRAKGGRKVVLPISRAVPALLITRSYRRPHALSCARCRMVLCVRDWTNYRA